MYAMELTYDDAAETFRKEIRGWLEANLPDGWGSDDFDMAPDEHAAFNEAWPQKLFEGGWICATWPKEYGGKGLTTMEGVVVAEEFARAKAPMRADFFGDTLVGPTLLQWGTEEQKREFLPKILRGEMRWCQGFSEPNSGSDLASLKTSAVLDGDEWIINGQKVWTSLAHRARWGLLLARTNPDVPKHKGLTYFVLDMHGPGVETRPLRQMTGQAEFNEVYFTDARIPDAHRLGDVGNGWNVAMTTLMNERTALGGSGSRRGAGTISEAVSLWASRPHRQTPVLRDRLTQLWLRAEAQRLTSERSRASAGVGGPGPEGSIGKLVGAELNQQIYQFCMDFLGPEGILYHGYDSGSRIGERDWQGPIQQRFLRSRANTIEGGTSEVMRNILGERILGLPGDLRADSGMPWKEIPRG